jgi:hypothetical protein
MRIVVLHLHNFATNLKLIQRFSKIHSGTIKTLKLSKPETRCDSSVEKGTWRGPSSLLEHVLQIKCDQIYCLSYWWMCLKKLFHLFLLCTSDSKVQQFIKKVDGLGSRCGSAEVCRENKRIPKDPQPRAACLRSIYTIQQIVSYHAILTDRITRCFIFMPIIPMWAYFGVPWHGKCWYMLWPLRILSDIWYILSAFVNFVIIWYIFSPIWYIIPRKIWHPCRTAQFSVICSTYYWKF